jgi:hypothetical protein
MFQHSPSYGISLLASKVDTSNSGAYSTSTNQTVNPGETVVFFISNKSLNAYTAVTVGGTNITSTLNRPVASAISDNTAAQVIAYQRFSSGISSGTTITVTIVEGTISVFSAWRIYGTSTLQNYGSTTGAVTGGSGYAAASNIGTTSGTVVDAGYKKNVLSLVFTTAGTAQSVLTGITAGYSGILNYGGAGMNQYVIGKIEPYWNPSLTETIAQQNSTSTSILATYMRFVA